MFAKNVSTLYAYEIWMTQTNSDSNKVIVAIRG